MALVFSPLVAGTVAADSSRTQQDQAFLNELARPATAPVSPVEVKTRLLPKLSYRCQATYCQIDADCNIPCFNSGFCNRGTNLCVPY